MKRLVCLVLSVVLTGLLGIGAAVAGPKEQFLKRQREKLPGLRPGEKKTDARIARFAKEVVQENLDCPMSHREAVGIWKNYSSKDSKLEALVRSLGCSCSAELRGDQLIKPDVCSPGRLADNYERSHKALGLNADEENLLKWARKLARFKGERDASKLRRRESVADIRKGLQGAAVSSQGESEYFRTLKKGMKRLEADLERKSWCLLPQDLKSMEIALSNLEKITLAGAKSEQGRAILDRANQLVKPHRKLLRACKKLENNERYSNLGMKLQELRTEAELYAVNVKKTNPGSIHCSSKNDPSRLCSYAKAIKKLEKQLRAIERKHGLPGR